MSEVDGLVLVRVVQTCSGFPSQWDAWTATGQYVYLRYRHGAGRVERHRGPGIDTADSWDEGLSELLVEWDDGSGRGAVSLEAFLAAAGVVLAPEASVS